jgi:arylsulfatase A-like enzyme
LRADRMGCYGSMRHTTPHLDRLAKECIRFDQAISPHIPTHPAHTTFFSGRDVFSHQIVAQGADVIPAAGTRLVPELLRERGYFTAAVDNMHRWFEPAFERYEPYPRWSHDGRLPWRNGEEVSEVGGRLLAEAAGQERPFFVFLHFWDPHTPYLPPPPFDRMFYGGDEKDPRHTSMDAVWASPWFHNYFSEWLEGVRDIEFVKAQYDASVAYCDHCVARVLQRFEALRLGENTLLIVHADHGEELDDHGMWFDHHGLYDTNVRVPLLMRMPGGEQGGSVIPEQRSLVDLAPTVLSLLGLGDLSTGMDGQTWQRLPTPEHPTPNTQHLYLTECTWMRKRGWRTSEWKLIEALESDIYGRPPVELYHLASDPGERVNVAVERADMVMTLQAERDAYVRARLDATGLPDPLIEQSEALRTWQPRFISGRKD